jgi:hypothetical protein
MGLLDVHVSREFGPMQVILRGQKRVRSIAIEVAILGGGFRVLEIGHFNVISHDNLLCVLLQIKKPIQQQNRKSTQRRDLF